MATNRPRITITLTDRQHEVLRSLSSSSGQSMSAYVVEFLDMALPTLERMAVSMQALARSREDQIGRIRAQLDEAQAVLEPLAAAAVEQADLFWGKIDAAVSDTGAAAAPAPTGARGAGQRPQSPRTNRGVTPTPAEPLKPKPGAASSGVRTRSPKSKKGGSR